MSLDGLRRALEALDEPTSCEGAVRLAERLAIMLPDGDMAAADDPGFVGWLVEHAEPAPFGHAGETKLDPAVRHAMRLVARGDARVSGFDPADVLGEIERALSPRTHLVATLTDVLVYPAGGHFARHKDTPRSPDLVGTLIVGLPIAHTGGAFHIDDGAKPHVVDWSGRVDPTLLRWVAVFSDVDHEIKPVGSGARVTLVYTLTLSDRVREDPAWAARVAALRASASRLQLPGFGPLMIACTRHVIAPDGEQPQGIETLRGTDREIADVLASHGFVVKVRTCVAARSREYDPPDAPPRLRGPEESETFIARLARPLLDSDVAELLECVTFEAQPWGDGGGYDDSEASSLAPYIVDTVPVQNWVIRRAAAATLLRAVDFADDGFVGNAAYEAYLYKLAAIEVTRR
jgi:hypothetical protein